MEKHDTIQYIVIGKYYLTVIYTFSIRGHSIYERE